MERKMIISEQPKCKTCGKLMLEWNPFADEHEHIECISERVSEKLIKVIEKQMKTINNIS